MYPSVNSGEPWHMRIEPEKFVDVAGLVDHFGEEVCQVLPAFYAITGCDITSYPYLIGKVRPFCKMISSGTTELLNGLGKKNSPRRI